MLIEQYDLAVFTPPREAAGEKFTAIARLQVDISDVLPYLNATLHGAMYRPAANTLTWQTAGHHWTLHADQVAIGNLADYDLAVAEIDQLIKLINRTWARRSEITPDYETRQRPPLMTVYKLLPQTNCRQCGEATCYSFAIKLVASQKNLAECAPLTEPQYAEKLAALRAIVIAAPAIG